MVTTDAYRSHTSVPWASPDAETVLGYVLGMVVTYVFAGIPVANRDAAVGRPPDLLPNDDEAACRD
jgi:hypothetical protein